MAKEGDQVPQRQSLYLAVTNQRANWLPPTDSLIQARGCTIDDRWWYASSSKEEVDAIVAELRAKNPNPVPRIEVTISIVDEIPAGWR